MKWPPFFMKIIIHDKKHHFGVWIPLFIVGPIVLVLLLAIFLLALPFALLALIFTWRWYFLYWAIMGLPFIFILLCNLKGLKVDVGEGEEEKVFISVN